MSELAKILLGFGVLLVILGAILLVAGNLSGKVPWLGRLPGDIYIRRANWTFYFPLATSLVISLILTLLASVCAVTALSGCGAPVADANGTASVAVAVAGH